MKKSTRTLLTSLALSVTSAAAQAETWVDYRPGLITERLNAGETLVLNFKAVWSGTSLDQVAAIAAQKQADPAYLNSLTFVRVDWDTYGPAQFTQKHKVKRHGTLLVLQGRDELARLVADTSEDQIKALLDTALDAAQP